MTPAETFEYVVATMRKLILRGMPPPRWFAEFKGRLYHLDMNVNTHVLSPAGQLAPEAALDLLTMDALRWYMEEGWNYQPGECSRIAFTEIEPIELYYQDNSGGGVANTPSTNADILRGPKWWAWQWYKPHKRRIHAIGSGPTILDAILAATAHLEPK